MKKIVLIAALIGGWYFFGKDIKGWWKEQAPTSSSAAIKFSDTPSSTRFRCDGRTHCSQMTSCEEAKFFLQNCPNTKMDGNHDGVPCEKQWCRP